MEFSLLHGTQIFTALASLDLFLLVNRGRDSSVEPMGRVHFPTRRKGPTPVFLFGVLSGTGSFQKHQPKLLPAGSSADLYRDGTVSLRVYLLLCDFGIFLAGNQCQRPYVVPGLESSSAGCKARASYL